MNGVQTCALPISAGSATVSNYINKNIGIPCIQIEIASNLRKEERIMELIKAFEDVILKLNNLIIGE